MPPTHRVHDKDILDALEGFGTSPLEADVWRVARAGRDPLRPSSAHGRWSRSGEFDVLYTSREKEGALAEIGYRLSLEPVWPRIEHEIHRIGARIGNALVVPDLATLQTLGVDTSRYQTLDYRRTQEIAAAATFLGAEALVVPNARYAYLNVVGLASNLNIASAFERLSTEAVDWNEWRAQQKAR